MIVGTRLLNGKIAHYKLESYSDYKQARNDVLHEMSSMGEMGLYTPVLVSIPDCGRNLKVSVAAHRVTGKDPLKGALDVVNRAVASGPLVDQTQSVNEAQDEPEKV